MEKTSIVIPVFNEEGNLSRLFEEIKKVAGELPSPLEIDFYRRWQQGWQPGDYKGAHRCQSRSQIYSLCKQYRSIGNAPGFRGVSNYTNMGRGIEGLYDVIALRWMIKRHLNIKIKEDHV